MNHKQKYERNETDMENLKNKIQKAVIEARQKHCSKTRNREKKTFPKYMISDEAKT